MHNFVNRSNLQTNVAIAKGEEIGHRPGTPSKIKLFSDWSKERLDIFYDRTTMIPWGKLVMILIQRLTTMFGKEECGVPGNSGYRILVDMLKKKWKERSECSNILWNKTTSGSNLQEAVSFEYRRRMPTILPMCHESGTEPWQSKKWIVHILTEIRSVDEFGRELFVSFSQEHRFSHWIVGLSITMCN